MNDIITVTNENMPTKRAEAEYLHYEILRNGNDAAEAMCNLAMNLKRMRDERLYTELGYNTFEDYTEKAVGLKKSQAYDYIKALENLGEDVFRSSGRFGISKVKVLTAFTPAEAAAFIDENDIDGMTVKELKAKVEELKTENDELQHRPIEVAVREPSPAEIAEYSKTAVEQAIAEREKKHAEEIKKIKTAARKEAEERVKSESSQLAEEISRIKQRSAELEKQLKLSASPEITRFSFYFDALQSNVKNLADTLSKINDVETASKLKANMCKFADMLKGMFM